MGEVRREPESAVSSEAGSLRRAARHCRLRSPRVPGRAGDPAQPGAPAGGNVPGRGTAGLSPPAQIQSNAATRGNTLRLSRHLPYGSPPPLFIGIYPGAFLSPEMQSPTNAEAILYLLSPFPHSFQWKKSPEITRYGSEPQILRPSPKSHATSASLACQRRAGEALADFT